MRTRGNKEKCKKDRRKEGKKDNPWVDLECGPAQPSLFYDFKSPLILFLLPPEIVFLTS